MARTIAIIQARMTSTRLPGKVLLPLAGVPVLDRVLERLACCQFLDGLCVAIPDGEAQGPLRTHLISRGDIRVETGPEEDVLERTLVAAEANQATIIVRVTSDCPFVEPSVVDAVVAARQAGKFDYARTGMDRGFPLGFDCEVLTIDALRKAQQEAVDPYEREHATPFIWRHPDRFSTLVLDHKPDRRQWRLVVDTVEDYEMARTVYEMLHPETPNFRYGDLVKLFMRNPGLLNINQSVQQVPYVFSSQQESQKSVKGSKH